MNWKPTGDRVIFLGAGFSAGMGYPVGAGLLPALIRYLRGAKTLSRVGDDLSYHFSSSKLNKQSARTLLRDIDDFLTRYFGLSIKRIRDDALDQALQVSVSISEFFTVAHALSKMPEAFEPWSSKQLEVRDSGAGFGDLYPRLAAAYRTLFLDISLSNNFPRGIVSLFRCMRPDRDVIINFNWDEEADYYLSSLYDRKVDVSYTLEEWQQSPSTFLILKPHGSIGWYDIHENVWNADLYPVSATDRRLQGQYSRLVAYHEIEFPKDYQGNSYGLLECPPAITPPTFAKEFAAGPQQVIWRDTISVCSTARRFVFLGYSLPSDDYLTRAAIRSALHNREDGASEASCLVADLRLSRDLVENFTALFGHRGRDNLQTLVWDSANAASCKELKTKLEHFV